MNAEWFDAVGAFFTASQEGQISWLVLGLIACKLIGDRWWPTSVKALLVAIFLPLAVGFFAPLLLVLAACDFLGLVKLVFGDKPPKYWPSHWVVKTLSMVQAQDFDSATFARILGKDKASFDATCRTIEQRLRAVHGAHDGKAAAGTQRVIELEQREAFENIAYEVRQQLIEAYGVDELIGRTGGDDLVARLRHSVNVRETLEQGLRREPPRSSVHR
ncbi:MAG TPA: hypothetical protein PLB31_05300 [Fimbriimonadaceae bacterium]|nr:hypothetical protein [Fimbriimonadaceae bacterium]